MTTETGVDLKRFCASETYGEHTFGEPFVVGGWRYATDGRIAVRVPAPGEPDAERFIKTIPGVFAWNGSAQRAWPDTGEVLAQGSCWDCKGYGLLGRAKCEECGGTGETVCHHCGNETECEECDGDGFLGTGEHCATCGGKGHCVRTAYRMVGEFAVRGDYDALIRSLPGVRWLGNDVANNNVHFVFDGGEGVVMRLVI